MRDKGFISGSLADALVDRETVVRILVFVQYYLPGFKAGGPTRSLANLIEALGDQHEFYLVTSDRDLGDSSPYPTARRCEWQAVGKANVKYVQLNPSLFSKFCNIVDEVRPELTYINSFFNPFFAAVPLMLGRWKRNTRAPMIVAPRGEFDRGAVSLNSTRKVLFTRFMKFWVTSADIAWQATGEDERHAIQRMIGPNARIYLAPNLAAASPSLKTRNVSKCTGSARLVYFSRITPKKNLLTAVQILARQRGKVSLDIIGPIEDQRYWKECERHIRRLPDNITVDYLGAVPPSESNGVLGQYDALLLPTLGENFGHALAESLAAGCPVLTSNRTPWRNLQSQGVGWDLPLETIETFNNAIDELISMSESEHQAMRIRATRFAHETNTQNDALAATERMFLSASMCYSRAA